MHHFINNYELINNLELRVLPSYVLSNIFIQCINVNQVKSESDSSSSLMVKWNLNLEPIYSLPKMAI